jgi:glycosyltransferase involved in cell wall biosynthesis
VENRTINVRKPTSSVVIPAFNVEQYVAEALDSVFAQTYVVDEVIVIDDGSNDGTAKVLDRYRDRIVCLKQENRGVAAARNAGLTVASGDLVCLLDADDVWLPERLERCVSLLTERPEVGFVTTDAWLLEDGRPTRKRYNDDPLTEDFPDRNQLARMVRSNALFASVIARRELYDRHGGFDEALLRSEDYDMWLRFLAAGEIGARIQEPLAYYRVRDDSLSHAAAGTVESAAHRAVLEKQLHRLAPLVGSGFGREAWEVARICQERGDLRAASRFFMLAARDQAFRRSSRARSLGRAALSAAGAVRHKQYSVRNERPVSS